MHNGIFFIRVQLFVFCTFLTTLTIRTKLVEAEEQIKSQRQLNQVLQLENFRLEQQLEEITDKMAMNQTTFQVSSQYFFPLV